MESNANTIPLTESIFSSHVLVTGPRVHLNLSITSIQGEDEGDHQPQSTIPRSDTTTFSDFEQCGDMAREPSTVRGSIMSLTKTRSRPSVEQGEQQDHRAEKKEVKASMNTLPTDLAMLIFEVLPHASATCLGLTCRGLYACLKTQHPGPIYLGTHDCCSALAWCCDNWDSCGDRYYPEQQNYLWQLLKTWIGPNYTFRYVRLKPISIMRFVNKTVHRTYDDSVSWIWGPRTDAGPLWARYQDWADASLNAHDIIHPRFKSRLPNPCNKGDYWDLEAVVIIKADITRFTSADKWRQFWSGFQVFKSNKNTFDAFFEECLWEDSFEAFKLLGL